jgi:hypothetical protein
MAYYCCSIKDCVLWLLSYACKVSHSRRKLSKQERERYTWACAVTGPALSAHPAELSSTHVPHINNLAAWESICSTPLPQEDPSLGGTSPSPSKEEGQGGGSSEGAQEDVGGGSGMERIHGPLLRTVLCLDQVRFALASRSACACLCMLRSMQGLWDPFSSSRPV